MESADWEDQGLGLFAMRMQLPEARDMLVVFNTGDDGAFALPEGNWTRKIDTSRDVIACDEPAEGEVPAGWQSVQVFVAG